MHEWEVALLFGQLISDFSGIHFSDVSVYIPVLIS